MPKLVVETYCGSVDGVTEAQRAGAYRMEPNSNLSLGGLTPSLGMLKAVKAETGLPIMAMVCPWGSAFLYTAVEFHTALLDAEVPLASDTDGIVFSFLNSDGTIDVGRYREMLRLAGKNQTVFHRVIDVVPDWRAAIDLFYELGVARILTGGQYAPVFDGAAMVAEMICYAYGRIEILPGSGTRTHNVWGVVSKTGYTQAHTSPHQVHLDPSTLGNPKIHFSLPGSHEDHYQILDTDEFEKMHGPVCAG